MKVKEPDIDISSKANIASILTWYSNEKTKEEAKDYLIEYVRKVHPEHLIKISKIQPINIVLTYCFIARLILRGFENEEFAKKVEEYVIRADDKVEPKIPYIKYQKVEYDIDDFLGNMEEKIDDFILSKTPFNINEEIKRYNVPSKFTKLVKEWADKKIEDFKGDVVIFDTGEGKITEKVFPITQKGLEKLIDMLSVEKLKKCSTIVKKKKVDPHKQIQKLKYLEEFNEFKSVNPIHIIGSKICIAYNTKYRVLSIFKSNAPNGLFIKGSSIYNFIETIGRKRIRKPEEMIKKLSECSKEDIMKIYDEIKTSPMKASGQINDSTLIVRVI